MYQGLIYIPYKHGHTHYKHTQYIGPRWNREDTHLTSDYREKQRERGQGERGKGREWGKKEKIVRGC